MKFTDKLQYLRYLVDKRGMKPVYMILGLTYDCNSFCRTCFNWEQLRKNKEQLVAKYNCRTVKFQVYVKDGKAALKATPVKDEG